MPTEVWNPDQYERFRRERQQPFFDLLALVRPVSSPRVIDLGCGTGELTSELHRRLGARETIGVDSSAAMLERAAAHAGDGLRFERGDIAEFVAADGFAVIFSNAALHWLPDHQALIGRLTRALRPGGQLAVQVPANHDHASGLAVFCSLAELKAIATLDLRIDYLRAAEPGRDLVGHAHCYKLTTHVAFVRATAWEHGPDDPFASALGTFMIGANQSVSPVARAVRKKLEESR